MNRIIQPEGLLAAVGFSHAIESSGERILHIAGQIGQRPDGTIPEDLVDQFRQALANVVVCMEEAGFPPESLTRMTIFTTEIGVYRESLKPLGRVYREVFGHHYPAIALLGVQELFEPEAKVEVVCTAVV